MEGIDPYQSDMFGGEWDWLDELQLSARSHNAIYNNQIASLAELKSMSFNDLMNLKGLGEVGAHEIIDKLESIEQTGVVNQGGIKKSHHAVYAASKRPNLDESVSDSISIYSLPLSARTLNALYNNGIKVASDLNQYSYSDLMALGGFGQKAYDELIELIEKPGFDELLALHVPRKISLDEYLSTKVNRSYLAIFDNYYGLTEYKGKTTLQAVSEDYGVTRERIRQIVKKVTDKVIDAINNEVVEDDVYKVLLSHVGKPLTMIPELSKIYRKEAIVHLFTDNKKSGLDLYKSPYLHSLWLIDRGDDSLDSRVDVALKALRAQVSPVDISELSSAYGVEEDILYDLEKVTIDHQGLIVLNSNKKALGRDVRQRIIDYMDKQVRPVTISQLCQALELTDNQVRGRLQYMSDSVVNVGKSTYGMVKYGYTGESIADISERLLREEGQPLHIDKITRFVTKYKVVEDSSVAAMMGFYPDTFSNIGNGYYALTEWGYDAPERKRVRYEVPVLEAVMSVFHETDEPLSTKDVLIRVQEKYGDKSTDKSVSIASVCVKLYEQGVLARLGTVHSPFYELIDKD